MVKTQSSRHQHHSCKSCILVLSGFWNNGGHSQRALKGVQSLQRLLVNPGYAKNSHKIDTAHISGKAPSCYPQCTTSVSILTLNPVSTHKQEPHHCLQGMFDTVTPTWPCWWSLYVPLVRVLGLWRRMERCRMGSLHHWHVDFSSPLSAPSAGLPLLDSGMGFLWKTREVNRNNYSSCCRFSQACIALMCSYICGGVNVSNIITQYLQSRCRHQVIV